MELLDGRYELRSQLGAGGFGEVFAAQDRVLEREVALKILSFADADAVERFRREFLLLASTAHPHMPRAFDLHRATRKGSSVVFYTAELVRGPSIESYAKDQPWRAVASVLADAVEALAWLHGAGILHGDFKPANILVRENATGVLIDLSAASALRFQPGEVAGTPRYLAPEILEGAPPSVEADLFAVGRTLADLRALCETDDDPALDRLVAGMLSPDPRKRPARAEAVTLALGGARRRVAKPSEPSKIVGREPHLDAAMRALSKLVSGEPGPRVIAIVGSEGMGKTRLLREILWRVQGDVRVVEGSARRADAIVEMVARASAGSALADVDALLRARDTLAHAANRTIVALDDAGRLSTRAREDLLALLRSAEPTDASMWIVTSDAPLPLPEESVLEISLGPLDEDAIARWTEKLVVTAHASDVLRATGGAPSAIKELCGALGSGAMSEAEIRRFDAPVATAIVDAREIDGLDDRSRRCLATLCIVRRADARSAAALGMDRAALDRLELAQLARMDAGEWRLFRPTRNGALLEALGSATVRAAADGIARCLGSEVAGASPTADGERRALVLRARALVGRTEEALEDLLARRTSFEWAPLAWVDAAETLAQKAPSAASHFVVALAYEAAGEPKRSLSSLARVLTETRRNRRRTGDPVSATRPRMADVALAAARAYEKMGREKRALLELLRARRFGALPGPVAAIESRCLLRLGRYADAAAVAATGAGGEAGVDLRADLAESLGAALGYLGDAGALGHLDTAIALRAQAGSPRARIRSLGYRALHAYRAGDTPAAMRDFEAALELAESHRLGDLVATAALNAGTARHQSGDWGAALRAYEKGLRGAVAYARARTEATLRFNLAKLHADIGLFDRASLEVERARARSGPGASDLSSSLLGLAAEIEAGRGRFTDALSLLRDASGVHEQRRTPRELAETALHAAEIALSGGALPDVERRLHEAGPSLDAAGASDLSMRHAIVTAKLALSKQDLEGALASIRRGDDLAAGVSQPELRARLEEVAAEVLRARGAPTLAEKRHLAAVETWEGIASTLPAELASDFWNHPIRRHLRRATPPEVVVASTARTELVLKLLAVNRRLSSTLDTNEILRLAMDAAIELTGAERGFVILATSKPKPSFEVAIARNLDRESVGKSQLKFSQGIAKRVIETRDPVLTVDALVDDRFSAHASVHGMRLRSILCVPIQAHDRVLGALYLDNRFQRGRFGAEDADLLSAFADQIALALHNGRLMAALEERTRQLEQEQRRVAELSRSQATEIERLAHELERERSRVDTSASFPEIAGRSAGMRSVLALIERVSHRDLPVTITGESGTGKELVARAIHSHGPRRSGPFVAVNCAALPENLLESELFGHVRGAFTGAIRDHGGLFLAAKGGTLFLDEIGETPPSVQVKLLRVLQEREVRPVGGERAVPVHDVRVVCATNRRLLDEVAKGTFREDLYYRIGVIEIALPPLRERAEDVPAMVRVILDKLAAQQQRTAWRVEPAALRRLAGHPWPGNVRQLENVLARATVLASGDVIGPGDLDLPGPAAPRPSAKTRAAFRKADEERITAALELCQWNVCEVSRMLSIPRTTLYRKLEQYGLLRR